MRKKTIRTYRELIEYINEVGFLPLFQNEIAGFSVQEHVTPRDWWTGDPERDPWEWREIIARTHEVAYGKFFGRKSGFISKEWFPVFANYRRDGYDFDALWDDGLVNIRHKKIMDCFDVEERNATETSDHAGVQNAVGISDNAETRNAAGAPSGIGVRKDVGISDNPIPEFAGMQLKQKLGFGKDGYKNFEGVITDLQMQTYLVIRDFRCKKSKKGKEYGMPVCIYCKPEDLWGYDMVTRDYHRKPEESKAQIIRQMQKIYPDAPEKELEKAVK